MWAPTALVTAATVSSSRTMDLFLHCCCWTFCILRPEALLWCHKVLFWFFLFLWDWGFELRAHMLAK
jgi:hypothetical protein